MVNDMYYRHNLDYKYPERSDEHMLVLKRTRDIHLDRDYDYMPRGAWFRIKRALVATVLHLVVFPLTHLTHGLRIYGRKNLKKHKKDNYRDQHLTNVNAIFLRYA